MGSWSFDYLSETDNLPVQFQLHIGKPENNVLYPAQIKITHDVFTGVYSLLLVKKNNRQLAIGRNKIPSEEQPFQIGAWTVFLNGTINLSFQKSGAPLLSVQRIPSNKYGVAMPAINNFEEDRRASAAVIRHLLREKPIALTASTNSADKNFNPAQILQPYLSGTYYGIMDTIVLHKPDGKISFSDNNKIDNDTVSVWLNGRYIIDKIDLRRRSPVETILLDTGLNILVFHAENYGRIPPNTGKLNLDFGNEKFAINFAHNADISSTFIVAKLYYYPTQQFQYPSSELLRNTKLVGEIVTQTEEVTLAIWDDALEDGDSISLNINGKWLAQGFAVKKQPQFLKVSLQPGENNIIFVADNLGAIPPNTSILEIYDGKKRISYMINTDLKQNNLVRITYLYSP